MGERVCISHAYAERDGQEITFGFCLDKSSEDIVKLVVRLEENGGLSLDPEFQEEAERKEKWRALIMDQVGARALGLPSDLSYHRPPSYVKSDEDRLEYVRGIVSGEVHVSGCGAKCQEALRGWLEGRES